MLGDWGGARTRLEEEKGIKFEFTYIGDFLANPQGGVSSSGAWNRVRGTVDIDFAKLAGLTGLTLHATGAWQGGVNLGKQYLGSIANPSGLVSGRTFRMDSYWLQQELFGKKLTIRGGQFAGMDFYGVQNYGGNYLMEPLDYAFGNMFNTYESFAPAAGPAVDIKIAPVPQFYLRSAYMSGNRDPFVQNPTGIPFTWANSGVIINEFGYLYGLQNGKTGKAKLYPGLYKVGFTNNPGRNAFAGPDGVPRYSGNYVYYMMANQAIFRPTAGSDRGLDVHLGFDYSPTNKNKANQEWTGGFVYNGLIPQRPKDSVAFGFVISQISDVWSAYELANSLTPLTSEKAFEFNYLAQITPFFMVQPVVQIYNTLGANPQNGTGVVLGFRTKVTF